MGKTIPLLFLTVLLLGPISESDCRAVEMQVQQSMILETEGSSCLGQDQSRNEARRGALEEARKAAAEQALTYVKSETRVVEGKLESDIVEAYAKARLKNIATLEEGWYQEKYSGSLADECYRVRLKVEVIPDMEAMQAHSARTPALDDPTAPLTVKVWLNQDQYGADDEIKLYLKANKPFFARIVYTDASQRVTQLLPNPYRRDNYFAGGVVYEFPSGEDHFNLKASAPFGAENLSVYAATGQLGDLQLATNGPVYSVRDAREDIARKVRGVTPVEQPQGKTGTGAAVEFTESLVNVKTHP